MLEFKITVPIQNIVLAVVMILILSISFSIFTTSFAQNSPNYFNSNSSSNTHFNSSSSNNTVTEKLQKLNINAKGPIVSMQNDNNGTWLISGDWDLINNASKAGANPFSFHATIVKVKPDNTQSTTYKISNFELDTSSIKKYGSSSQLIFNGTASIKTKAANSSQVPIKITIIDKAPLTASMDMQSGSVYASWVPKGGTISISIDDKAFTELGSQIYGIVKKGKS